MERKAREFSGRTEEEAVARACAELGLLRSEIEYTVVDPGGRSLFGLRQKDVVISAHPKLQGEFKKVESTDSRSYHYNKKTSEPEPAVAENQPEETEVQSEQRPRREASQHSRQHRDQRKHRDDRKSGQDNRRGDHRYYQKAQHSGNADKTQRGNNRRRNDYQRQRYSRNDYKANRQRRVKLLEPAQEAVLMEQKITKLKQAVNEIFSVLGFSTEIDIKTESGIIYLKLNSTEAGEWIKASDRLHGELQFLLDKIVNPVLADRRPIELSIEAPLTERELRLKESAIEAIKKAIALKKPVIIGPMNSSDRRIVHLAAKEHGGVTSESRGTDHLRRVALIPFNMTDRHSDENIQQLENDSSQSASSSE